MATDLLIILSSDWVGSTATRTRIGEESADALQEVHDALLRKVIGAEGGHERLHRVAPAREIGRHHDHPAIASVLHHPGAHGIVRLVAGLAQAEDARGSLLRRGEHAGEGRRSANRGLQSPA